MGFVRFKILFAGSVIKVGSVHSTLSTEELLQMYKIIICGFGGMDKIFILRFFRIMILP